MIEPFEKDVNVIKTLLSDALRKHDWYYEYSDSYIVFRNGEENRKYILELLKKIPIEEAKQLWTAFCVDPFRFPFPIKEDV